MKFVRYTILAMLMAMGLAACGGNAPATTTNTGSTGETNSSAAPADTGLEYLHYTLKLGDAVSGQFEGTSRVIVLGDAQRLISLIGPDNITQALLQMPTGAQPGEYELTSGKTDYRAQVATSYEDSGTYTENVTGTLKITSASPLQGTFEFSAKTKSGETASASGSFDEQVYSYGAQVTGALEMTLPTGEASAIVFQDEVGLNFSAPDSINSTFSLTFYLPADIAAGDYGLATVYPKPAAGQVGIVMSGNNVDYGNDITGTLNLTATGDKFSGSYTITADDENGKTLTVEGTFTDIPLVNAKDS